ncbi:MAG: hypothetical protein IJH40_07925 [Ruminococcus sp.]|uniref:hypothetical protein n=1 Tax=Ruminococcus sp. TaxID=41978 RepID=UPI002872FBA1|nr:hypothetical protein [Ruminococcus sp.]MBQ3285552.1 hypothetical protein [Ruminococcus sp.]
MDVKIRRLESNMTTIGTGIIAFGFWSFAKFLLSYFIMGSEYLGVADDDTKLVAAIIAWSIAVLSPLLYLWIGLSARAEGKGKHKSVFYLIIVGLIILLSILVIGVEIVSFVLSKSLVNRAEMVVTMIIDVTRMIFLIELMVYSIKLRRLRKQLRKGEANEV